MEPKKNWEGVPEGFAELRAAFIQLQKENKQLVENSEELQQLKKELQKNKKKLTPISTLSHAAVSAKIVEFSNTRSEQLSLATHMYNYWQKHPTTPQLLIAEEKSGKRIIVEAIHLLTLFYKKGIPILFASAHKRKSCEEQFDEMRKMGLFAEAAYSTKMAKDIVEDYTKKLNGKNGLTMLDEADYASGSDQTLAPFHYAPDSSKIYISATLEEGEIAYSMGRKKKYKVWHFKPHKNFRGAAWFKKQNLVKDAHPFLKKNGKDEKAVYELSNHGLKIIRKCRKSPDYKKGRNVIVVRRSRLTNFREYMASCNYKLKKCPKYVQHKIIMGGGNFVWSDPKAWAALPKNKVIIIYICGLAKRSTELAQGDGSKKMQDESAHARIYAWHDKRKLSKTNLNTLSQAVLRPNHYHPIGHQIFIYTDIKLFKYKTGEIKLSAIKNPTARVKSTIKRKTCESRVIWAREFKTGGFSSKEKLNKWWKLSDYENHTFLDKTKNNEGYITNYIRGVESVHTFEDRKEMEMSGGHDGDKPRAFVIYNKEKTKCVWNATMRIKNDYESDSSNSSSSSYEHQTKSNSMWPKRT